MFGVDQLKSLYEQAHDMYLKHLFILSIIIVLISLTTSFKLIDFSRFPTENTSRDSTLIVQMEKYDIKFYHFDLEVSNIHRDISGMAEIHISCPDPDLDTIVLELSNHLNVDTIKIDGLDHSFTHANHLISIGVTPQIDSMIILQVYYWGSAGTGFYSGIHRKYTNVYGRWACWTFSQPHYAYKWFPCKQLHSDKIDSVRMVLRTDSLLTAVS